MKMNLSNHSNHVMNINEAIKRYKKNTFSNFCKRYSAPGHNCPKCMKNYNFSSICAAENYEGAMHSSSNGDSDDIFC